MCFLFHFIYIYEKSDDDDQMKYYLGSFENTARKLLEWKMTFFCKFLFHFLLI